MVDKEVFNNMEGMVKRENIILGVTVSLPVSCLN